MSDDESQDERRATPRFDVQLPARVHVGDDVIDAQTIDISNDAVMIGGEGFPSAGEVFIEIELAELGWQRLAADVVRSGESGDEGVRMAATFADAATAGGRDAISAFLKRHII
jgi:PilZ domain